MMGVITNIEFCFSCTKGIVDLPEFEMQSGHWEYDLSFFEHVYKPRPAEGDPPPQSFENYKELLRKSVFTPPPLQKKTLSH